MPLLDFLRRHKRRKLARKGFAQAKKVRRKESQPKAHRQKFASSALIPAFAFTIVWLVASFSVLYRGTYPVSQYVVGQIADRNIYSEVPFEYESIDQTRRKRQQAVSQEAPVYWIDRAAIDRVLQDFGEIQALIHARMAKPEGEGDGDVGPTLEDDRIRKLVESLPEQHVTALEYIFASREKTKALKKLVSEALMRGIAGEDDVASLFSGQPVIDKICLLDRMDEFSRKSVCPVNKLQTPTRASRQVASNLYQRFPENAAAGPQALLAVLPGILQPNLRYDSEATDQAREKAAAEVQVVSKVVPAGVVLLRRGTKVTQEDITRLEKHQHELSSHRSLHQSTLDMLLSPVICLVLILAAAYCLFVVRPETLRQNGTITLIGLVLALQILLTRAVAEIYHVNWSSSFYLFPLLPLSLGAMVLSPLVGMRVAVWAGAFASAIAALHSGQSLQLFLIGAVSALVGAILIGRARKRFHKIWAWIGVSLTIVLVDSIFLFQNETPLRVAPIVLGLAFLNGAVVITVASMALPFLEWMFGITTEATLLELSDLNHPLLKRLQLEAPGTYHHSLMVATLSEQAAEAIGANPLLARVCSYFHDIGKLSYPEYFSENTHSHNPHDELQPRMSSLVILNHVKEGIDLALKHKLKKPIREVIAQHHGTNLVYYFYRRALEKKGEANEDTPVGEQDYRYPGPLPTRKEIALISIADSCEAAARSLEKPTPQKISALVAEIVLARVRDHQLDEADLTFAELAITRKTIAKALGMMLHARVRYPKEFEDEADLFKAAAQAAAKKPGPAAEGDSSGDADQQSD